MIRIAILAWSVAYVVASATIVATEASLSTGTPQRRSFLQATPPAQASAPSGKEILQRKCFQCHQATMWSSVRGDRRAWLGVLYRMVGRGALWTEEEINAMADFMAQTRGPK
jgi:cytochrome c5